MKYFEDAITNGEWDEVENYLSGFTKEQGYKPKSKSLQDVLKLTHKMEAKLIGYNEIPTDVSALYATGFNNLKVQDSYKSGASSRVHPLGVEPNRFGDARIKPIRRISSLHDPQDCRPVVNKDNYSCPSDSQTPVKKLAKSRLFKLCAANCWNPPIFECCKETGDSHLKEPKSDCSHKNINGLPIDTVRRRMMMTSGEAVKYKSSMDAFTQILKNEGAKSLFKGAGANILRAVAGAGVLTGYDKFHVLIFGKKYGSGGA